MKKFFVITLAIIAIIIIAFGSNYCFHGITAQFVNGTLVAISFCFFQKRWNKISEEDSYQKLQKITTTIITLREQDRRKLIEMRGLSWCDLNTIVGKLKNGELDKFDLREIFANKMPPSPLTFFDLCQKKGQMVWNGSNVNTALNNLEYIASYIFVDNILDKFIYTIEVFIDLSEASNLYDGASTLATAIAKHAPALSKLAKTQQTS